MQLPDGARPTERASGRRQARASARGWRPIRFSEPPGRSLEAPLFKVFPEISQAAATDRSDRAGRQPQLLGDILVGPRWIFEKEQSDHPLTFFGQLGDGIAQDLFLLELHQQVLGKVVGATGRGGSITVCALGSKFDQPVGGALIAKAFV